MPDEEEQNDKIKKNQTELGEEFNIYAEDEQDKHISVDIGNDLQSEDNKDKEKKVKVFIDASEQISVKGSDEVMTTDEIPNEIDIVMPIEPTRYQRECYLNFGYDSVDRRIRVERVRAYLGSRGLGNNSLTKARKRTRFEDNVLDFQAENFCDFCGKPLSGVSYDVLADGRIRCNDCSTTAVRDLTEFKEIYTHTEMMMENIFEINYPVAITIKTVDAVKMSKRSHSVYQPTNQFASRVLGLSLIHISEPTRH